MEALSPERDALWARIERTSFLSNDEKCAAVRYGDKPEGGDCANRPFARKYREDQARDDQGRWVDEGGGEDEQGGGDYTDIEFKPTAGRGPGKPPAPPAKPAKQPPAEPPSKEPKPKGPESATPADPPKSLSEVLLPGGKEVGSRQSGAGDGIRTLPPSDFDRIQADLLNGARPVATPSQYGGQWYERPDGTVFGVRQSRSGPVVEVTRSNDPILKPGYKVHRK